MKRLGITHQVMRITFELMGITDQKVLFKKCVSKGAFSKVRFSHSYARESRFLAWESAFQECESGFH